MKARPIRDQLKVLHELGMKVSYCDKDYRLPMIINSRGLTSRKISISGKYSSQFLSGILMAAPYVPKGLLIHSKTDHYQPYVGITATMMSQFGGIVYPPRDNIYSVPEQTGYKGRHYCIEPDVSTASYFWAAAALTAGEVSVNSITTDTIQGDIQFLTVLERMGCIVHKKKNSILVIGPKKLRGVCLNMRNFSDTFMTVVAIACFAESDTHITGICHTIGQESNRIRAMLDGLKRLGVHAEETNNSLHIYPQKSKPEGGIVEGYNDHRIAMSLALIGLKQEGVIINGAECVSKTCPDYFQRMSKLFY
jgi:3-phosphoshikimate 1-carboxyvinyltransferase